MGGQLVKILGIEHHELYNDPRFGNMLPAHDNVLENRVSASKQIYHKNELALLPDFDIDVDIIDSKPRRLQKDASTFGFKFPTFSDDDIYLVQLVPETFSQGYSDPELPRFRVILAREGEYELLTNSLTSSNVKAVSVLTKYEEAALYTSPSVIKPTSRFDVLSYNRTPFTEEQIENYKKSLPLSSRANQEPRGGLRTLPPEENKPPFPGPKYKELVRVSK